MLERAFTQRVSTEEAPLFAKVVIIRVIRVIRGFSTAGFRFKVLELVLDLPVRLLIARRAVSGRPEETTNKQQLTKKVSHDPKIISATLSDEDAAAVVAALNTIKQKLPFLIDLSPEERRTLPKMGDKSRGFVRAALTVAQQNLDILPRALDVDESARDVALEEKLARLSASFSKLAELLDDTLVAVGSDAYVAALTTYQCARIAGKGAGLDDQLDALGQRFARKMQPSASEHPAAQ